MYYLNNNLKNLVRIFDQNERKNYLRLDLNGKRKIIRRIVLP